MAKTKKTPQDNAAPTEKQLVGWLNDAFKEAQHLMDEGGKKPDTSIPFDTAICALAQIILQHSPQRQIVKFLATHLYSGMRQAIESSGLDEKHALNERDVKVPQAQEPAQPGQSTPMVGDAEAGAPQEEPEEEPQS